jgi:hypothetical protein
MEREKREKKGMRGCRERRHVYVLCTLSMRSVRQFPRIRSGRVWLRRFVLLLLVLRFRGDVVMWSFVRRARGGVLELGKEE